MDNEKCFFLAYRNHPDIPFMTGPIEAIIRNNMKIFKSHCGKVNLFGIIYGPDTQKEINKVGSELELEYILKEKGNKQ